MNNISDFKLSSIENENESFSIFLRQIKDSTQNQNMKKRSNSVISLNSEMIDDEISLLDSDNDDFGYQQFAPYRQYYKNQHRQPSQPQVVEKHHEIMVAKTKVLTVAAPYYDQVPSEAMDSENIQKPELVVKTKPDSEIVQQRD